MFGKAVPPIMKDQNQVRRSSIKTSFELFRLNCVPKELNQNCVQGSLSSGLKCSPQRLDSVGWVRLFFFDSMLNTQGARDLSEWKPKKKKKNLKLILAAIIVELIVHHLIERSVSILFNNFHTSDNEEEWRCKSSLRHSPNN